MQLTNNAIQKDAEDYGKFEEGNIISAHTLFEYIAQSKFNAENETKQDIQDRVEGCMKKIIIDTCKAVKTKI
jgi:hypothetical protein